jgi:hypothetical protein
MLQGLAAVLGRGAASDLVCLLPLSACLCSRDILLSGTGLAQHHDNYHEFCKLLGRLKTNYQLSELVSIDVLLARAGTMPAPCRVASCMHAWKLYQMQAASKLDKL